jgi:HD superfamily phosphodiesterase
MTHLKAKLVKSLVDFFGHDFRRIEHALDVLAESERLAAGRPACDREILMAAALLHDVGIRDAERALGYNDGPSQEKYGPPAAGAILRAIGFPEDKAEKVREIIGNHHSPPRFDYEELAVLREADGIVNRREASG